MTAPEFRAIGLAAFGSEWRPRMAENLEVEANQVDLWASGKAPIPDVVQMKLLGPRSSTAVWPY